MSSTAKIIAEVTLNARGAIQQFNNFSSEGRKSLNDLAGVARETGKDIERSIEQAGSSIKSFTDRAHDAGVTMAKIGAAMSALVTAPLIALGAKGTAAWNEQIDAMTKVDTVIRSTGGAAGKTGKELLATAEAMQKVTRFGDEAVLEMQALLLTFTHVKGDVFDDATMAIANMASALGTDLKSEVMRIGRALQDPVQGITALTRAGVVFTQQQKDMVKELVESGNGLAAQKLILAELEVQFGGMAEAMGRVGGGPMIQAWNAVGDVFEDIGRIIEPFVHLVADGIKTIANALLNLDEGTKRFVVYVGAMAAAIGPLLVALGAFSIAIGPIMSGLKGLWAVLAAHPLVLIGAAIVAFVGYLYMIRDTAPEVGLAFDKVGQILSLIGEKFLQVAGVVRDFLAQLTGGEATQASMTWTDIGQAINTALQFVIDNFEALATGVMVTAATLTGAAITSAVISFGASMAALVTSIGGVSGAIAFLNLVITRNKVVILVTALVTLAYTAGKVMRYLFGLGEESEKVGDALGLVGDNSEQAAEGLEKAGGQIDKVGKASEEGAKKVSDLADNIGKVREEIATLNEKMPQANFSDMEKGFAKDIAAMAQGFVNLDEAAKKSLDNIRADLQDLKNNWPTFDEEMPVHPSKKDKGPTDLRTGLSSDRPEDVARHKARQEEIEYQKEMEEYNKRVEAHLKAVEDHKKKIAAKEKEAVEVAKKLEKDKAEQLAKQVEMEERHAAERKKSHDEFYGNMKTFMDQRAQLEQKLFDLLDKQTDQINADREQQVEKDKAAREGAAADMQRLKDEAAANPMSPLIDADAEASSTEAVVAAHESMYGRAQAAAQGHVESLKSLWGDFTTTMGPVISGMWEAITKQMADLTTRDAGLIAQMKAGWGSFWMTMGEGWAYLGTLWEEAYARLQELDATVIAALQEAWAQFKEYFAEAWASFTTAASDAYAALQELDATVLAAIYEAWGAIKDFFGNLWTSISTAASDAYKALQETDDRVVTALRQAWDDFKGFFIDAFNGAIEGVQSAFKSFLDWVGSSWVGGLVSAINKVIDAVRGLINWLLKAAGLKDSGKAGGGLAYSKGGPVWGAGTATSDSIDAKLSAGEFVMRTKAVRYYGQAFMRRLNNMTLSLRDLIKAGLIPRFNMGGLVGARPSLALAGGGAVGAGSSRSMTPLQLTINQETFEGLLAPEHTASQIVRYSVGKQNVSTGSKPWWFR